MILIDWISESSTSFQRAPLQNACWTKLTSFTFQGWGPYKNHQKPFYKGHVPTHSIGEISTWIALLWWDVERVSRQQIWALSVLLGFAWMCVSSFLQLFPWLLWVGALRKDPWSVSSVRLLSVLATLLLVLWHVCVFSNLDPHGSSLRQLHSHNLFGQPWHSVRVLQVLISTKMESIGAVNNTLSWLLYRWGSCFPLLWWDVEWDSRQQKVLYCWVLHECVCSSFSGCCARISP